MKKGREVAIKMMDMQDMFLQSNKFCFDQCFDINGRKPGTITKTQATILKIIQTFGEITISQLEKILPTSKSSLSITLNRLLDGGYVKRTKDECDRRVVYFIVTEKGIKAVEKIHNDMVCVIESVYENLEEENQILLETGIDCFSKFLISQSGGNNK